MYGQYCVAGAGEWRGVVVWRDLAGRGGGERVLTALAGASTRGKKG